MKEGATSSIQGNGSISTCFYVRQPPFTTSKTTGKTSSFPSRVSRMKLNRMANAALLALGCVFVTETFACGTAMIPG